MAYTDLTIGSIEDLIYYVGETFWMKIVAVDKNGDHINWTDAAIEDMVIFVTAATSPTVTIDSSSMTVNEDGDIEVRVDDGIDITRGRYLYELPVRPAGGGPRGIFNGKIKVNDRG